MTTTERNPCGTCTMCCKLLAVQALDKPAAQWCTHCTPGVGCKVYNDRPDECVGFECVWLQSQAREKPLPLELRPDHSRVVMAPQKDGGLVLHVDPARPDAHKRGAMGALVDRIARSGEPAKLVVVCGPRRFITIRSSSFTKGQP